MTRRYTAKELRAMTLKELDAVGKDFGLQFTKHHTRWERSRRILAAYTEADLALEETSEPPSTPADQGEPRPAFESLVDGPVSPTDADDSTAPPQRGGIRPGSGRPEGMTDALAAYKRLPKQPHPAVQQAIEMLFQTWSVQAKCPAVALTEDEAFDLALPWTQALDLMGVAQRIPPWLMVTLTCLWSTATIAKAKAAVARQAVAARKQVESAQATAVN